ncbi:MAG TPA: SGNH/GDSL hydrolase family protein, partial [Bacteroidales bacterium]|nr:SGNH/GDSL hydrolase family protein [Bacteroidales bacterium]
RASPRPDQRIVHCPLSIVHCPLSMAEGKIRKSNAEDRKSTINSRPSLARTGALRKPLQNMFMMKINIVLLLILISVNGFSQTDPFTQDWANLKKYESENRSLKLPADGENRVVFLGNSITEFWKYADSSFFIGKPYLNRGISGQTTPQMLLRFRPDVIDLQPAVVVILAGINDIAENTGPASMESIYGNIISMVQLARANEIKVVICSILPANHFYWRPQIEPAEKVIKLNSLLENYCKQNNLIFLDYYSGMVDSEKGLDKKYTDDGVHPTLAGYKYMEPLVEEAIQKALK